LFEFFLKFRHGFLYHFRMLFNERDMITDELKKQGIPFMIHYPKHISDMPVFQYLDHNPEYRINDKIISLPCHPFMQEEHIQQVEDFLKQYKQYEC